jgi:transcriptional regulator with AAA-type ATPase domain
MAFLTDAQRRLLESVSRLGYGNPFLTERVEYERAVLGAEFVEGEPVWSYRIEEPGPRENVWRIYRKLEPLAEELRGRLSRGARPGGQDLVLYEDAILHLLYSRYYGNFYQAGFEASRNAAGRWRFYADFRADWRRYFEIEGVRLPTGHDPRHTFACFRQIQRAFEYVFRDIIGNSLPAARLRAAIWQSIFTHDMRRYRRGLWQRMHDVPTLIVGPTGTGKELVARAIGLSRHIPFQAAGQRFAEDFREGFFALNLSAVPPTLIESELFGHRRGAFTGAVADRQGWLEVCPPLGTVFLDEIAEVDVSIQVKLLRVLQARTFQRVGDTRERRFQGKIIAATNRDLAAEMGTGRFRHDLYYRLCADVIQTPSLASILRDAPGELPQLLRFLAARIAGEGEAEALAAAAERWICERLGPDYAWPGNVRELEQCIRNVMVRGTYHPARPEPATPRTGLAEAFLAGSLTADEVLRGYCTLVYARTGSYLETARRLALDRRTVTDRIDRELLAKLREETPPENRRQRARSGGR